MKDRCEASIDSCRLSDPAANGHGHGHSHHNGNDHDHGPSSHAHTRLHDRRRLLFTLGLSSMVFVAELVGGLWSHSLALVSDAGHVLADMSGLLISLIAIYFAARPATSRRTFGYHRLEILAAVVNGVVLVGLAAVVVYAALQRLGAPTHVHAEIMLPVAAGGLIANLAGAWLLHGAHTLNARSAYLHVLSDALSSVAVLVGGSLIAWSPRFAIVDPILGLIIAAVVVAGAIRLLREGLDVLLEAVPRGLDVEKVRSGVREVPGVVDVHDLHIWCITSGLLALSAHIVIEDGTASDPLLRQVKDFLLKEHHIGHSTLQIESTSYDRPD